MKTFYKIFSLAFVWAGLLCGPGHAQELWKAGTQELQKGGTPLELVESVPAFGTFWLVLNKAPYPFDPYHGALPIYEVGGGIYLIDDTSLELFSIEEGGLNSFGGEMALMSGSPSPPGLGGTNGGGSSNFCCSGPTNFTVAYTSSTNGLLWLEMSVDTNNVATLHIFRPTTNALDLFGSTNLNDLALPALSRTNWLWLLRTTGATTNFSWMNFTPCEAWFRLGTMLDTDGDGLTDAYENLVSHTSSSLWDTDGDLIPDGWELLHGLNPLVNDANSDPDGDGLTNLQEYFGGTDPHGADNFGLFLVVPKPGSIVP